MEYQHLSAANKRAYNRAIVRAHARRIELHVRTLDGRHVSVLTPVIVGGSITTDVTQTPMQVASVTFVDRTRSLVFEPDSPGQGAIHRKYAVRIVDSRKIPNLGWVDCDVFTGPIWDFQRNGPQVQITCHSVDRLASGTVRKARVWRRKTRKTDVIKGLLQAAGARVLRIPDLKATTPVHVHVGVVKPKKKGEKPKKVRRVTGFHTTRQDTYWDKASGLADSENRLLFPAADGAFEMRPHPKRPVYHFNQALLADVELKRPGYDGPNVFIVTGGKPKGSKRKVTSGKVGFRKSHPLSASELAWHGEPYEVLEEESNPHLKTKAACRKVAFRKRDKAARQLTDVTITALPIPWLRPWDLVTAQAGWGTPATHIEQMTYPLTPDNTPMTVGAVKEAIPMSWGVRGVS